MSERIDTTLRVTVTKADGTSTEHSVSFDPLPQVVERSRDGLVDLAKQQFKAPGQCIYCGATDGLSREHIVPFGLNGDAVLQEASCPRCSAVTGAFERAVLRGPMRAVRVLRRLRSRRNHAGASQTARLTIIKDGASKEIDLPLEEYPVILHFPIFAPPAPDDESIQGAIVTAVHAVGFGPHPEVVLRKLGATGIHFTSPDDWTPFARMIAKIAYAFAVAQGAVSSLDGPGFVLPAILGVRDDIGRWVGTAEGPIYKYSGTLHRVSLGEHREAGLLLAQVQIFADSETPAYNVVLGRLKNS